MNEQPPPVPPSSTPKNDSLDRALLALRARTPARLIVGRSGAAYRTNTQLELRADHAAAVDAVRAELDLERDFPQELIARFGLFTIGSQAESKDQYLQRPELGRQLSPQSIATIRRDCPANVDLQVVIGDGLSAAAAIAQAPGLLPRLAAEAQRRGWTFGRPFVVRHCRVGVLNAVGAALAPRVVVLLIGERPGLNTAESLSAYMAYRPDVGHTDAQRNLVSNIHARGVSVESAADRIVALAAQLMQAATSGIAVKEQLGESRIVGEPAPRIDRD